MHEVKLAIIGLDTSHSVEFPRRMQAPDCPPEKKVDGMRVLTCMRFPTPFQDEAGQDKRQTQLEAWGIKVTRDFNEAVADCDAVLIEINDPAFHLEYFKKCAELGKPLFLDKPLADNISNGAEIIRIAKEKNVRMFSASSLRHVQALVEACEKIPNPLYASVFGPLGAAPSGSSIIWYGVHSFEMLERAMGTGALTVKTNVSGSGAVCVVEYPDRRRGVVELTTGAYVYGGCLRNNETAVSYLVDMLKAYSTELAEIRDFVRGEKAPVAFEDTVEVMAMLDAADRSMQSGAAEAVFRK